MGVRRRAGSALVLLCLFAALLPPGVVAVPQALTCPQMLLSRESCEKMLQVVEAPGCLSMDVGVPDRWIHRDPILVGCPVVYGFRVSVGPDEAWGRITFSDANGSSGGSPPAPDSRTRPLTVPAPDAAAGFDLYFELRYRPCADPLFFADERDHGSAPPLVQPEERERSASLSLSPACEAAARIVASALPDAPALDLLLALVGAWAGPSSVPAAPAELPPVVSRAPDVPTGESDGLQGGGGADAAAGDDGGTADAHARAGDDAVDASARVDAPDLPDALGARAPTPAPAPDPSSDGAPPELPPPAPEGAPPSSSPLPADAPPAPAAERPPPGGGPAPTPASPAAAPPPPPARPPVAIALAASPALALALARFYSRIARERVLDHPLRRRVYDALRVRRRATPREIGADLGLGASTVRHHLETLSRHGLAGRVPTPRGPVFRMPDERAGALPPEPEPLERRVLDAVAARPGANMSEVARALGVSKRAVRNHVLDLLAAGRLLHRHEAGARLLYPGDA